MSKELADILADDVRSIKVSVMDKILSTVSPQREPEIKEKITQLRNDPIIYAKLFDFSSPPKTKEDQIIERYTVTMWIYDEKRACYSLAHQDRFTSIAHL